jgi:prophage tail gpP-like protein
MRFLRSVEHLPSICYLDVSERVQAFSEALLAPFIPVTLSIGGDLVLTGYCDVVEPRVDKSGHQISAVFGAKRPIWLIAAWTLMRWRQPAAAESAALDRQRPPPRPAYPRPR